MVAVGIAADERRDFYAAVGATLALGQVCIVLRIPQPRVCGFLK